MFLGPSEKSLFSAICLKGNDFLISSHSQSFSLSLFLSDCLLCMDSSKNATGWGSVSSWARPVCLSCDVSAHPVKRMPADLTLLLPKEWNENGIKKKEIVWGNLIILGWSSGKTIFISTFVASVSSYTITIKRFSLLRKPSVLLVIPQHSDYFCICF